MGDDYRRTFYEAMDKRPPEPNRYLDHWRKVKRIADLARRLFPDEPKRGVTPWEQEG